MKAKSYFNNNDWDILKVKIDSLKESVDYRYLLDSLDIFPTHETSKELRCLCPIHGGDNKTAFRFNKETRTWTCFTNKCHTIYGNDIIGLVRSITGTDFQGAIDYLKSISGGIDDFDYVEIKKKKEMDRFVQSSSKDTTKPKSVSEDALKKFKFLRSNFFVKQGFDPSTLDYFEIAGGWPDKYGIIRDIIPIRDDESNLIAYSLRDIRDDQDKDYKYILTPGFNKQDCLYNLHNAQLLCNNLPLILVEGFKSVWRLYEYGIRNVVATIGACLTYGQQCLLYKYVSKGVVIMFDNDKAGVDATTKACNDLIGRLDIYPVYIQEVDNTGKGLDPADLSKDQVYDYLRTYF